MTNEQTATLVLKDGTGTYYILSQETLEQGRVPAEAKAALEAQLPALQAIGTADDDAQGYAVTIVGMLVGAGLAWGGVGLGLLINDYISQVEQVVPSIDLSHTTAGH